jgi:cell division protein FtsB
MRSHIVDKDILEEMARSELGLFADNDILILPNID